MSKSSPKVSLKGRTFYQQLVLFFAFGFGTGFIRPAPGTWGTLPGIAIAYLMMGHFYLHLSVFAVITVVGIFLCNRASQILGVHDHGGIVIDEIAGVLLTLVFFEPTWLTLLLGFAWFRFFDILKPPPILWVDQRVHSGLGIMLDDLIAGAFAGGAVWISLEILKHFS